MNMYTVIETEQFAQWLNGLKDRMTRARLQLQTKDIERAKALAQELRYEQDQNPAV